MTIREKLINLRRYNDMVLYRWTAGYSRIADEFYPLQNLRLVVLSCNNGNLVYSSSAPIMYNVHGRPVIVFKDRNVMTIIDGSKRKNLNVECSKMYDDETAVQAHHCGYKVIEDDFCPKWLEKKILHMGTSPVYPVAQFRMPDMFRLCRKPDMLKPIFSKALLRAIGGEPHDSSEILLQKFQANRDKFGKMVNDGYIIDNSYVAAGGCVIVATKGIPVGGSSVVHTMPLKSFEAEASRRHWDICTANNFMEYDNADGKLG